MKVTAVDVELVYFVTGLCMTQFADVLPQNLKGY